MNKKETIAAIILLVLFSILGIFLFSTKKSVKKESTDIKQENVKIVNEEILMISDKEKKDCISKLIKYINKQYYYNCSEIDFYNNTFDESSNSKYFYALVIGSDESLIEITNLGNSKFKFEYIGNQITQDNQSSVTGVTYLQIVDPDEYNKEKKLEEMRKDAEKELPDDTEMP